GSHLPPDQNGFKMTLGTTPFYGDDIQGLVQRMERANFRYGKGEYATDIDVPSRYMGDVTGRVPLAEKPLNIVVDAGNGMAGAYAPTLLRYLGHTVVELYCNADGTYPNHPADPFEEKNLLDLKANVMALDGDLGLAFDGDADRVGVVDRFGNAHATDRAMIP